MLSKLRDLLDELNESEKVALAGGKYTTSNLREIRDLIAQWFASVNLALPEAFAVSATALAVYEANYVAKLYGAKINKPDGEKLFLSAKKVPLAGGALVDDLLSRIAESARQRLSMQFEMVLIQAKLTKKLFSVFVVPNGLTMKMGS